MGLIAVMSLAGSIVMVIYYLARGIFRDRWNVQGRERMLKLAMFFFLCPIQKIKFYFPKWFVRVPLGMYWARKRPNYFDWSAYTVLSAGSGEYLLIWKWKVVLICVGFIAALAFVIYQMNRYYRLRKALTKCSVDMTEALSLRLADRIRMRTFYKIRVRILRSPAVKTPFELGILRPMIWLPGNVAAQDELEIICCHELVHIKKRDVLVKCICLLIILVHWFNPFSYLLLIEFGRVSEFRCDREVLKQIKPEERSTYAKLIVSSAVHTKKIDSLWTAGFGGGRKDIYNRVEAIMDRREKKRTRNFAVIMMLAVVCASMTTYAYEKNPSFNGDVKEGEEDGTTDWVIASFGENGLDSLDDIDVEELSGKQIESELDFSCYNCAFISDDTGEVFYFTEDEAAAYKGCTHTYISGVLYRHVIKSGGGCEVLVYKGKRCKDCGRIIYENLIETHSYATCPH